MKEYDLLYEIILGKQGAEQIGTHIQRKAALLKKEHDKKYSKIILKYFQGSLWLCGEIS